jgi:hypothetical protein
MNSTSTLTRRSRKAAIQRHEPATALSAPPKPAARVLEDPATFPDFYCMKLDGECLEPIAPHGGAVMMQKSAKYAVGDLVCIWFRPEFVTGHPALLKRLMLDAAPWVKHYPYDDHPESDVKAIIMVEQLNPRQTYTIPCSHILAIHKAVGYAPTGQIGGTISKDDVRPFDFKSA